MAIRVLIADDEPVIRRGLAGYMEDDPQVDAVGDAPNGELAVQRARELGVDVVLMDVRMPGGDGIVATRELVHPTGGEPSIPVVVITAFDTDEHVFGAFDAGATGLLLKTADPEELIDAVQLVARGEGYITPELTRRVLDEFARRTLPTIDDLPPEAAKLTSREFQIVQALTLGFGNDELARRFHVSSSTVKSQLNSIKRKLHLRERRHIVVWAFRNGLAIDEDLEER